MELSEVAMYHPDARRLIGEVQQEYIRRYGATDESPVVPAEFATPNGTFLVGYSDDDGGAVACGGWRLHDGHEPDFVDGDAEIKRMYVVPDARGKGYARTVLAELERTARTAGRLRMVLETGIRQPEAIALYVSSGYTARAPFGLYRDAPDSRCFAKSLRS